MPIRPVSLDRRIHGARRRGKGGSHADPLYGLFYPPNHLRLVNVQGDPADVTRCLLTFDRDLAAPLPAQINLWAMDRKAVGLESVNPRVVRVFFNAPISSLSAWNYDTFEGTFRGADGCAAALGASGILTASGPTPPGKLWLQSISRAEGLDLDFTFSAPVTSSGEAGGFWCLDESNQAQYGSIISQQDSATLRITFNNPIATADGRAGLVANFAGIAESADCLSPVIVRI